MKINIKSKKYILNLLLYSIIVLLFFIISDFAFSKSVGGDISGLVRSKNSNEAVVGASVYITLENSTKPIRGVYTNKFGFFSLPKVKAGKYIFIVSAVSFSQYKKEIVVSENENLSLQVELESKDIHIDEVVVEGNRDIPAIQRIGAIDISPSFIEKMPAIFGEIDVFRSLQLLPGVQTSSEISSGLYVRGGSPDQNLCLLDGVIVYNPAHFGGFFSVFNTDALKDIKLIKGGFPAEYGGRLSSVLDITMKEGSKERFSAETMISLISSKLTIEGPITKDASFMISGRRMYFDILMNMFMNSKDREQIPTYYFYDLNAKINYKFSEKDHLFISGFFARDVVDNPEDSELKFGMHWGNKTANIRWMHIASSTLFTNFSVIHTDYNFYTKIELDSISTNNFISESKIKDLTLRAEAQLFPADGHIIKSGVEITKHNFEAGANSTQFFDEMEFLGSKQLEAIESAFYIQDDWLLTKKLASNIGFRVFYFNKGNYFNLEPRISLSYELGTNSSLKSAFSVANQFLHLITREDISLPTDLWFPSTDTIKPSKSYQIMLGYEKYLFNKNYYFTVEAYYKKMYNLYEYKDSTSFSLGLPLEEQFTQGKGEAYGIEFFFNKQVGDFSGWIGYTLAWTKRIFSELNLGRAFPPRYDRRHDISIVLSYKFNNKWEIGSSWVYGTGQAYTMPTGAYSFDDDPFSDSYIDYYSNKYQYSDRNGVRLPAFHKLDLNIMYKSTFFGFPSVFSLNIYNVYNRKNPFAWYIDEVYDESTYEFKKVVKQLTLFPIIPSIGYSVRF